MSITSPFGNLYLQSKNRLMSNAPSLRYIDQDLGQLEHFDKVPAVSLPCALIDIDDTTFQEAGELTQTGDGILKVRICLGSYSSSSNLSPDDVVEEALSYYEIEQEVFLALHGWGRDNFKKLIRISAITEKRNDNYRVRVMKFRVGMQDDSATPLLTTIARPDLTLVTS